MKPFVLLLSPFAPHLCEELWKLLGGETTLAYEPWPEYDEALTVDAANEVPIQIKGKTKAKIMVPSGTPKDELEKMALAEPKIVAALEGMTVRKVIVVPDKLVNIVAG